MRYLLIDTGPWPDLTLPWWCKALQRVLPAANPDLEALYPKTRVWWLEVTHAGAPCREIGFDAGGEPVVLGPIGRNFGFLVDSSDDWSDSQDDSAEAAEQFEVQWSALLPQFSHLESE